jgi:hypothetical protein
MLNLADIISCIQIYQQQHNKQMSCPVMDQLLSNTLYYKLFLFFFNFSGDRAIFFFFSHIINGDNHVAANDILNSHNHKVAANDIPLAMTTESLLMVCH